MVEGERMLPWALTSTLLYCSFSDLFVSTATSPPSQSFLFPVHHWILLSLQRTLCAWCSHSSWSNNPRKSSQALCSNSTLFSQPSALWAHFTLFLFTYISFLWITSYPVKNSISTVWLILRLFILAVLLNPPCCTFIIPLSRTGTFFVRQGEGG